MPRGPVRDADEVRAEVVEATENLMIERGVRAVRLRDVNWLGDAALTSSAGGNGLPIEVKVRSTRPPQSGAVHIEDFGAVHCADQVAGA